MVSQSRLGRVRVNVLPNARSLPLGAWSVGTVRVTVPPVTVFPDEWVGTYRLLALAWLNIADVAGIMVPTLTRMKKKTMALSKCQPVRPITQTSQIGVFLTEPQNHITVSIY